jgi:hypothetical protein
MTIIIALQIACIIVALFFGFRALLGVITKRSLLAKTTSLVINSSIAAAGVYVAKAGMLTWMSWYAGISVALFLAAPLIIFVSTIVILLVYASIKLGRKLEPKVYGYARPEYTTAF